MHYPLDSDLFSGWRYPRFEQPGPELDGSRLLHNQHSCHTCNSSVHRFLSLTVNSAQQKLLAGTAPSNLPEATITAY